MTTARTSAIATAKLVASSGRDAEQQRANAAPRCGGGVSPVWSRDGRELFYQAGDSLMAVSVGAGPEVAFGPPRRLFGGKYLVAPNEDGPRAYDVAPDGKRFLMLVTEPAPPAAPPALHVLLNWAAGLPVK